MQYYSGYMYCTCRWNTCTVHVGGTHAVDGWNTYSGWVEYVQLMGGIRTVDGWNTCTVYE